ncbi:MAG TPA: hypothetical protein IAC52_02485 [Candidatus Enteromonas pullicola]|uniref:Uncharacterized protein n=1 Tax=Candidatus Alloenteromonas pullicola TaxID=2840784 RepID=A0A9D1LNK1_9FIRM|nr:hypothetical protein [Candidatus Enteromonas pullicola]
MSEVVFRISVGGGFLLAFLIYLLLRRFRNFETAIMWVVGTALLIEKIVEYILTPLLPTELSHWSYLLLGLAIMLRLRFLYFGAGSLGLLSAFGYFLGVMVFPPMFLQTMSTPIVIRGIITHSLLLLLSLHCLFSAKKVTLLDMVFPLVFTAALVVFNYLLMNDKVVLPGWNPSGKALVMILDGTLLQYIVKDYPGWAVPIMQVTIGVVFVAVVFALNRLSRRFCEDYRRYLI